MTDISYALWGTGDITPENAKALLDTYIPDRVGTVFRPDRTPREMKGLRTALDWFETPDFLGEGGAVPSTDLIASLVAERDGEFHDEVCVLALWPEVPGHEDFDFIEAVQREGIKVLDLSRAMDELDLSLYERPAPTTEEKAAARAAAREEKKRATAAKKLSDAPPQDELPYEVVEVPEEGGVSLRTVGADYVDGKDILTEVVARTQAQLTEAIEAYVNARIALAIVSQESEMPFDVPDTKEYYWRRSANTFRVAEGKPRRGESVVNLTDEEAREKGINV